jgi:hypothetical protein
MQEGVVPSTVSTLETSAALQALRGEVEEMIVSGDTVSNQEHVQEAITLIQKNTAEHTAYAISVGKGSVAQDMEDRAASIIGLAQQVTASAQSLSVMAQELQSLVSQFKLPTVAMPAAMPQPVQVTAMPFTLGLDKPLGQKLDQPLESNGGDGRNYEEWMHKT